MAKLILYMMIVSALYGDIFETNCKQCHDDTDLNRYIKAYTLKYSSEDKIKQGLYEFLRNPTSNIALMSYQYIIKRGYKKDSSLSDKELKEAIEIYYQKFNMAKMIR